MGFDLNLRLESRGRLLVSDMECWPTKKRTRLSCHRFVCNQVRLLQFVLAYNLGNFLRRLALPNGIKHWSLRSPQVKLIKTGGRIVRHARHIIFQLAEVAVSRQLFRAILERIRRLWLPPPVRDTGKWGRWPGSLVTWWRRGISLCRTPLSVPVELGFQGVAQNSGVICDREIDGAD